MPEIGTIAFGRDIEKTDFRGRHIWTACKACAKERWVRLYRYEKGLGLYCRGHSPKLKGLKLGRGRRETLKGYVTVRLLPDDFYYPMADGWGFVREHRLVMAKSLNRCLLPWEVVHHKNGIKDDNRIENLELLRGVKNHLPSMLLQRELAKQYKRIADVEARIILLEAENTVLKIQLQTLVGQG